MIKEEVINLLGNPTKIIKDRYSQEEYSETLYYNKLGLSIMYEYIDSHIESSSIFSNSVVIDEKNISNLDKIQVLKLIASFHKMNKIEYMCEIDESGIDECYHFPSIGLMVWFGDGRVNEVCVFEPLEK